MIDESQKIIDEQYEQRINEIISNMNEEEKSKLIKQERKITLILVIAMVCLFLYFLYYLFFDPENLDYSIGEKATIFIFVCLIFIPLSLWTLKIIKDDNSLLITKVKRKSRDEFRKIKNQVNTDIQRNKEQNIIRQIDHNFILSKKIRIFGSGFIKQELFIDNVNKSFAYVINDNPSKKYNFSDIINYEVVENNKTIIQGRNGSALVGSLLFGIEGAVIGSSLKRSVNDKCNHLKIIIRINDIYSPQLEIVFIKNTEYNKSSSLYSSIVRSLEEVCSLLEVMMNSKNLHNSSLKVNESITIKNSDKSKIEQLKELKEMLDAGLISEDDYQKKKNQILEL